MRVLWRLAAWLLNVPLPIRHFDFTYPEPDHHEGYDLVFPAPRRYEQGAFGCWFKASELQTPVSRDEPGRAGAARFPHRCLHPHHLAAAGLRCGGSEGAQLHDAQLPTMAFAGRSR